jgi:hypothetical protein
VGESAFWFGMNELRGISEFSECIETFLCGEKRMDRRCFQRQGIAEPPACSRSQPAVPIMFSE